MATLLFTHSDCLEHDTGDYHPECAERLRAVLSALEGEEFSALLRIDAPKAERQHLLRAHDATYVDWVLDQLPPIDEFAYLDSDTIISAKSGDAALRAAGAMVAAVDAVALGTARNAFCAVRPPGHHAEQSNAMGFCVFNNAAIAALHARDVHGFKRVAVVDFDVHHGNGTQRILWDEPNCFYASIHQENSFPNTGLPEETGGRGRMINVPLPAGTGSDEFRRFFSEILIDKLQEFEPDFIIISAGFAAHLADPLAHLRLAARDFKWATEQICQVAAHSAGNRIVSCLEGGYDMEALAYSTREHVRGLMGA